MMGVVMPTADHVAVAVVTAARQMSVDPEIVVGRRPGAYPEQVAAARARAYAAMALDHVFNGESKPKRKHGQYPLSRWAIARMIGAPRSSQPTFVNSLENRIANRQNMGWWRLTVLQVVVDALREVGE